MAGVLARSREGLGGLQRSWSLGGPIAEAVTCGTEGAQKRRTRRIHRGRRCDSPGAMGHGHRGLRSGFVCAG